MPSKASLPSALVDATDVPPQSIDSAEHFSKQSSSRSKLSSNNSSKDEPPAPAVSAAPSSGFMQKFKMFRRKSENNNQILPTVVSSGEVNNSISYRRPSLVVTQATESQPSDPAPPPLEENWNLKPTTAAPTSPDKSFLKAPSFLKVS